MAHLQHSLDIWHKAKKLTKMLHGAGKDKNIEEYKVWIDSIMNHFWYSCASAKGDVEKLKRTWIGVLHHICGEHSWAESECSHGPLVDKEPKKKLKKGSPEFEKVQSVVLDRKFCSNLSYYTTFRHTGGIENLNSMLTKYAPKRCAFDYPSYLCRMAMSSIDHNMHANRPQAQTKDGRLCYKRKYVKSTRRYHAAPVKEEKEYKYIPYAMVRIIKAQQEKSGTVLERVARVQNN